MCFIGKEYHILKKSKFWKYYYYVIGFPFMPHHLIYYTVCKNVRFESNDKILDYGSGDGVFLNQLSKDYGLTGTGVDKLLTRVEKANYVSNAYAYKNSFICADFQSIEFNKLTVFSKIICLDVLEHVKNPLLELQKLSAIMDQDSELIIQTPRDKDKKYILKQEHFLYGEDEHVTDGFSFETLEHLLEKSGLKIKYWQSTFPYVSQIIYEMLELLRNYSKFIYALLWPLFYPICILDFKFHKQTKSNGLLIIAKKI